MRPWAEDAVADSLRAARPAQGGAQAAAERTRRIMLLLPKSAALRNLGERADEIRHDLRCRRRKIWPLAQVARLFGVSETLLRRWIKGGLLKKYRPPKRHRKGITQREIRRFLKEVTEKAQFLGEWIVQERARPAEQRCRDFASSVSELESFTPREFARRAKVAATTVRRLARDSVLPTFHVTSHRIRIGKRPNLSKNC